ncbi:MAG: type II secretion system F family protein [Clostridiaceae bacterium]
MTMVFFFFLMTVTLLILALFAFNLEKEKKIKDRIEFYMKLSDHKQDEEPVGEKREVKFTFKDGIKSLKNRLRKYYNNTMPSHKEEEIQKKLLNAGNPFRMTVADYYIINNVIRVIIPLLFGAYSALLKLSFTNIVLMVLAGFAVSFKALDFYIGMKTKDRYKKALRELPDFLDILTISVEAGLGFDLALGKTIEKREGILCSEFNTCLEEMRLGKIRKEALMGVKERLAFDEMISFVNSIIQSEKLGTGIVNTLRSKSEDERDKRKQRAEEVAMKTTIKILFPLIFFIFPTIFIITFGPAVLELMKNFSTMK